MKCRIIYMVVVTIVATTIFLPHAAIGSTKKELKKFEKFIKVLDKNYINTLDYHYLIEVAIKAILDQTDPYSTYLRESDHNDLESIIESSPIDSSYMVNDSTAYIKVSLFSQNTASEIDKRYRELDDPTIIILDLRGNKGGLLSEAIATANLFLEKGEIIFKRNRRNKITTYIAQHTGELIHTKVIIMIDNESASASEIVAAALQNSRRALIVGEKSYGKALITTPFTLPDNSVILIATSQYTTPNGKLIQRSYKGRNSSNQDGGINPDIIYKNDGEINNEDFTMFIISTGNI